MFHNILTLDFANAESGTGKFTFPQNVYKAVDIATGGFAVNFNSDHFTPFRAIKNNAYYRLEFTGTSTSYYVAENNPSVVTTTQPT